jgi:uncharacterized membrane protein YfcA
VTPQHVVLVSGIVLVGAVLQGSVGFGLGLFGAPLLLLVEPALIPGPLLLSSIALTLLLTRREWGAVGWGDLKWAIPGRVVGVLVAAALLATLPQHELGVASGAFVLGAVALSASGLRVGPTPRVLVGAGALSGFLSTSVSIGGPPMALVYQYETGPRIRGTLSAYFVVGVVLSLIGLHVIGRFGATEALAGLTLVPGILLGYWISRHTARWLDRGYMRSAVLIVSALTSVVVILRELL